MFQGDPLTTEESKVSFPYRLYKDIRNTEVESRLVFIRDSLELILNLYHHDNRSSVAWDTDKMDRFLMSVDRQIDGLNTCVSKQTTLQLLSVFPLQLLSFSETHQPKH
ncbi:interferon a3-like isoform X1 [Lates japonicus]